MKKKQVLSVAVFLLSFSYAALADRELDRTEILQIFQELTSQPRKAWITTGTIEATREEYRATQKTDVNEVNSQIKEEIQAYLSNPNKRELTENLQKMKLDAIPFNVRYELSNEYTMNSTVSVRFDGDRFYWEINVESREDSVKPNKELTGNFMTDQFNLDWNARRIFACDGETYTTYCLPVNHAMVDSTGTTPHVANGPLTAGIIPWGYGFYTYENLSAIGSSAVEKVVDNQTQIHLELENSNGSETVLVMDPEKDFAVISYSRNGTANWIVSRQYSNYQLISGRWVPTIILTERHEAGSNRLLARDLWDITAIDGNVPQAGSFKVEYETDALVEYASNFTDKPLMYRYSTMVDTELLLAERLTFAASEGSQPQNCATAALKYTLSQLGKDVTDSQLGQLVSEPNDSTSLYAMKEFAQGLGLFCRAVKTDIQTLSNLEGCEVILHIPSKHHFVVLAGIDNEYVWTIDLASNQFYYGTDLNFFGMDWTEGTALIISNQSIELQGNATEIDVAQLVGIIGSGSMGYRCGLLLQEEGHIGCDYIGGECLGYYYWFHQRLGCMQAQAGNCKNYILVRYQKSLCLIGPPDCYINDEEWIYYYMLACE